MLAAPPTARARLEVDVAAPRADLEALELTAEQLRSLGGAGQRLSALRRDANRCASQAAADSASGGQAPLPRNARTRNRRIGTTRRSPAGAAVHRAE
ncbi:MULTISPECIES: hypothetical protein [unclassified Streptomyces]|uniref:hypothetical protein n=1 Tax=unclassified Streptomyces TaxID=2593676 RepID=UPI003D8B724B